MEFEKEKISVIIPVYNVEKYLKRCLDSVINQTYKNLEIILVDDGSTDTSGKICDEYAKIDSRIKVIHKFNGGLSSARNVGIEHASGSFISFIDSDDWVGDNFIASFCKYAASDRIIICGYKKVINQLINVNSVEHILFLNRIQFENLLLSYELINSRRYDINPIGNYMMTKFFPSWVFKDIRFPEGHVFEDAFISMKLFNKIEKFIIIPEAEYYYIFRNNSIVNTPKKNNLFDAILARIEQENGLLIVSFEPKEKSEEWEPKDGDVITFSDRGLGIFKEYGVSGHTDYVVLLDGNIRLCESYWIRDNLRPATESEKQRLFDALTKAGKRWNAEKKCIENLPRWRAEKGSIYFSLKENLIVSCLVENNDFYDDTFYKSCNYFRTREAAEKVATQIRDIFKNSKAE